MICLLVCGHHRTAMRTNQSRFLVLMHPRNIHITRFRASHTALCFLFHLLIPTQTRLRNEIHMTERL